MARAYQLVSGDSHLDLIPERWTSRVPAKWRERAPRLVKLPDGKDGVVIENRPLQSPNLTITGVPYDQHDLVAGTFNGPGTGSPQQRLQEQDRDGVDAEIMYTHPSHPNFWRGIKENEGYLALIRAYNEFLAEEYCAYAPDRLMAMGVIPDTGVDDAIAELEYCARAGLKGACIYTFPSGKSFPTPDDDRFWAASLDLNMPITAHTNGGTTRFSRQGQVFQYAHAPADAVPGRDPVSLMVRFGGDNPIAPLQLTFAGVFDRFPRLRVYWAETQIGWLAFSLWQTDDNWERNRYWSERIWGLEQLKRPPSEYLREHNLWGFMKDPVGVRLRHDVGVHALIWGSDFAHASGDWPYSRRVIEETFVGVPDDERYRILVGNAVDFFRLDVAAEDRRGTPATLVDSTATKLVG